MTPRIINRLLDPLATQDDINWDDIDILNDLCRFYPKELEAYLLRYSGLHGETLIERLNRCVDELRLERFRPDHIRIASLNRIILNLKGLVNF